MDSNRVLKVYQSYSKSNMLIPEIKLKGQWLQEIGFNIGANIEVHLTENMLIIKPIATEEKIEVKSNRKPNRKFFLE